MKSYHVAFSQEAELHLCELQEYIVSKTSRKIAENYLGAIVSEAQSLARAPYRGEERGELKHGIRTIGFDRSVSIVFRIVEDSATVDILAILYRGRLPSEAHRYERST